MADPTFFDLFKITWAQSGLTEGITDLQYKTGWAYIGSIPPSVEQFNKVQQTTDERLAWLYKQLDALAAVTGRPLLATGYDALSYAFQNLNATNLKTGTVPVARLSGTASSLTAGAATKLATARAVSISGDGTATENFDGTSNLSLSLTLANSGVTAGAYGNANQIATFTVDAKGRLTAAGQVAVGNAATATKLATSRTFLIKGGATAAAATFDGSGNVELDVTALDMSKATTGILDVARGGTGLGAVTAGAFVVGAADGAMMTKTPAEALAHIGAAPLRSPSFQGQPLVPTAEAGTCTDQAASTRFVFNAISAAAVGAASEAKPGALRVASQPEVVAGAADDLAVSPKKLRMGFSARLDNPGYLAFPTWLGGLILQWGTVSSSTGTASDAGTYYNSAAITFPIAFPTAYLVGFANAHDINPGANESATLSYASRTAAITVFWSSRRSTPMKIDWLAIGR